MGSKLYTLAEVIEKINSNKPLILAGDESVLAQLPKGKWVAGSIPYFMSDAGGEISNDKIFVNELPSYVSNVNIKIYTDENIKNVYKDAYTNGFSVIIIPASGKVHFSFALNAPGFDGFASTPLIGWISGIHLNNLGKIAPCIMNGESKEKHTDNAIVMHIELPVSKVAEISTINIFSQGEGDTITFSDNSFSANEAFVNGIKVNFAEYVVNSKLDTRLPLVANYNGSMVNISFQSVDEKNKTVNFYAPVFKGIEYKHAAAVGDYITAFTNQIPNEGFDNILFSCNCILNFLYSELEGKTTSGFTGPITFGEIAYQLLNQTLVYIKVYDVK